MSALNFVITVTRDTNWNENRKSEYCQNNIYSHYRDNALQWLKLPT